MISMIYFKKPGGTVKVHNADVLKCFIEDCKLLETEERPMKKNHKHSAIKEPRAVSTSLSTSTMSTSSKSKTNQSGRSQNWLNQKTIKELQEKVSTDHNAVKQLHTRFLETEETFIKQLDDFLAHKEFNDLRKKELLHKKWTEKIYEPIRKRIINVLDGPDRYSLDSVKREAHKQFIEHVNKRGFVFLEDDDKEDYYAQVHQLTSVKPKAKKINDPLHVQKRQRYEEDSTILCCLTGHQYTDSDIEQVRLPPLPLVPLGRHGVNSCLWLEMPRHNVDNLAREKRIRGDNTRTSIDFRDCAQQDCDAKVAAQEQLQIPHKRMFKEQPPFGKPPVEISHVPFIDPEEFLDKIVNTNPFQQHMTNWKAAANTVGEILPDEQACEKLKQQQLLGQDGNQQHWLEDSQQQSAEKDD